MEPNLKVYGIDFSSSPSKKKPIVVARGFIDSKKNSKQKKYLIIEDFIFIYDFFEFEDFLRTPGPWFAGFDLPFSMPFELVEFYNWPKIWNKFIVHKLLNFT